MGVLLPLLGLAGRPRASLAQTNLDAGSAIHGSTVIRRRSSNTPTPWLNQLQAWSLLVRWLTTPTLLAQHTVQPGNFLAPLQLQLRFLVLWFALDVRFQRGLQFDQALQDFIL